MSELLVHSQICEDERYAFEMQLQLLGCYDAFDVVDSLLIDVAAAHNAQVATVFAQDTAIAEKQSAESQALLLTAVGDSALARESHQIEQKKEALGRLDRELAQQIEQMPNRQWQKVGEQMHHPELDLASHIASDVVASEQEFDLAKQRQAVRMATQLATQLDDSQEVAFESVAVCKASKTMGKSVASFKVASSSAGALSLSASAVSFVPAGQPVVGPSGSSSSALSASATAFEATEVVDASRSSLLSASAEHFELSEPSVLEASTTLLPTEDQLVECMICQDSHEPSACVFPIVQRQPKVGDLVCARFKPLSRKWKSAIVLRTSPAKVKQPWVAVTFEGFEDEVIIPWDRVKFAPSSVHAASVWEDDGASGWACGHSLCTGCLRPFLESLISDGKAEVACCQPECDGLIMIDQCTNALGSIPTIAKLAQRQHEGALAHKVFCANTDCGCAFDAVYATLSVDGAKSWPHVQCPRCCKDMCADCHVSWHDGVNCASFRQLPDSFRDQGDIQLLHFAVDQQLRKCPSCGMLVGRQEGDCNWIQCRCGCRFCYGCGTRYKKHKPTANNQHGTPGCKCELWTEVKPHETLEAVLLGPMPHKSKASQKRKVKRPDGPYKPGKEQVQFLRGMELLPVPCKFSTSHAGCPWGKKCWYRHAEDD